MTADAAELEAGRESEWKNNEGMQAGVSVILLGGRRSVPSKKGVASWRDSYDFEIHHGEEVSISSVLVKT